jgi:hypothetical protein
VVRAPASAPETDRHERPAFPLVGPSDGAGDPPLHLTHGLPSEALRSAPYEQVDPPESAAAGPTDTAAPSAAPAPARPAAPPTADDVAGELRHTLLVERERFGVLADLW